MGLVQVGNEAIALMLMLVNEFHSLEFLYSFPNTTVLLMKENGMGSVARLRLARR